jgi:hypothetical protein
MMKNYSALSVSEGVKNAVETLLSEIANDLDTEKRIEQICNLSILECKRCYSHDFNISAIHTLKTEHKWSLEDRCEKENYGIAGYRTDVFERQYTLNGKLFNPKRIDWSDLDSFLEWISNNFNFFEKKYKDAYSLKKFEEEIVCPECFDKASESDWKKDEIFNVPQRYDVNYQIKCGECEHQIEFGVETEYGEKGEAISSFSPFETNDIDPFLCVPFSDYLENWLRKESDCERQNDLFLTMVQSHMRFIDHKKHRAIMEKSHTIKL